MNSFGSKLSFLLRSLIPPIFFIVSRKLSPTKSKSGIFWRGNYNSWSDALQDTVGYDDEKILDSCSKALSKVKNGEAAFERDGFLFEDIVYSWPLLAILQKAAIENSGKLVVLDFGGSLGSTYYQLKGFFSKELMIEWCVVEQKSFVECGLENFENTNLHFFHTVEDCLKKYKPNLLLLNSVLQYLDDPYTWIGKFMGFDFPYVVLDRTGFVANGNDILTIQNVKTEQYATSYPAWFFGKDSLIKTFLKKYSVVSLLDDTIPPPSVINGNRDVYWGGIIFKK